MRIIEGDLIALAKDGQLDVIAHGCNCHHTMAAGLAAQIRRHFPDAYAADLATPFGDRAKLGTCSFAEVETEKGVLTVVNAYTQFRPSTGAAGVVDVDYDAVRSCMAWLKSTCHGLRIGLPQIGAGLAGGDWTRISGIIAEELAGEDVTIVKFGGAP
jgi:O-acetyl-ADP-ribose deacetylase (regulator of RNase III)